MSTTVMTGDSRGLGATITATLLADGHTVVGLSRSTPDTVSALAEEYPERYVHHEFDLSNVDKIETLYHETLKQYGPITGLVNNAAFAYDDIVTNADVDTLSGMFDINVLSPIMLSKYCLRDMLLNRTAGSLVHVSSVSTMTGYKGLSMYAATKGALEAFSLGVAREWGERGIRSNCIAPGFMETEMTAGLNDADRSRIYDRTALKESTQTESVADAVSFLLSDAAQSITGEALRIDSGTL